MVILQKGIFLSHKLHFLYDGGPINPIPISNELNQPIYSWTIHLRCRQIFHDFLPLPPYRRQFFTTIRRQIWQIFDPSPPKTCRRLKWMVP